MAWLQVWWLLLERIVYIAFELTSRPDDKSPMVTGDVPLSSLGSPGEPTAKRNGLGVQMCAAHVAVAAADCNFRELVRHTERVTIGPMPSECH